MNRYPFQKTTLFLLFVFAILYLAGQAAVEAGDGPTANGGPPGKPHISASDGDHGDRVTVSWNSVTRAANYQVFRGTSPTATPERIEDNISETSFNDYSVTPGKYYYYWVVACNQNGCSQFSSSSLGYAYLSPPALAAINNGDEIGSYTVKWSSIPDAGSYQLEESYDSGSWNLIYSGSSTQFDRSGRPDGEYCYRVRSLGVSVSSSWSDIMCTKVAALTRADMAVLEIGITDYHSPYHPNEISISARLQNRGPQVAENVRVDFYTGSVKSTNHIGYATISEIQPDEEDIQQTTFISHTLNSEITENLTIIALVSASTDDPDQSNDELRQRISILYTDFQLNRDAFNFLNPRWDDWPTAESFLLEYIKGLPQGGFPVILTAAGRYLELEAVCYGMAYASSLYHEFPETKPVIDKETFELTKKQSIAGIRSYHGDQMINRLLMQKKGQFPPPKTELAQAEALIRGGRPAVVSYYWEDPLGLENGVAHTVAGYKILKFLHDDGSPDKSVLFTYENEQPFDENELIRGSRAMFFDAVETAKVRAFADNSYWTGYAYGSDHEVEIDVEQAFKLPLAGNESNLASNLAAELSDAGSLEQLYAAQIDSLTSEGTIAIVIGSSTADAVVTDSQGRRIGFVDGKIVNEIPGAAHGIGEKGVIETYFLPDSGQYTVTAEGKSTGALDLYVLKPKALGIMQVAFYDQVKTTSSSTATVVVQVGEQTADLRNDLDGDDVTDKRIKPVYDVEAKSSAEHGSTLFLPSVSKKIELKNTITNIVLDPPTPASLGFGQRVNINFNYTTMAQSGVRIWAAPFTNGAQTPNNTYAPSPLYLLVGGSGSGFITVTTGDVAVDQIRFQMWTDGPGELLHELFVPVNYWYSDSGNYTDDFSDPDSGWYTGSSSSGNWSYEDGEYQIENANSDWYLGSMIPFEFAATEYIMQADMRQYTGDTGYYGFLFNREDWDNFYVFRIHPNTQQFSVRRRLAGTWDEYVVPWEFSYHINTGQATNQLKLVRSGQAHHEIFINGHSVAKIEISSGILTAGRQVGFISSSGSEPVKMRFDNFSLGYNSTASTANKPLTAEPALGEGFDPR